MTWSDRIPAKRWPSRFEIEPCYGWPLFLGGVNSRRQKYGVDTRSDCEIVLLPVGRDEVIKAEFHYRHVQQVSGLDRNRLAVLPGQLKCGVEYLVVFDIEVGQDPACHVLLPQRQADLKLRGRQQRLAVGRQQPSLSPSHVQHLHFVQA